ncbi:MAG TPA: class I SAM-dependent methyltransferase [Gemmatimonadaceae bacterium]|jgi:SAM-dependent methyltransferase
MQRTHLEHGDKGFIRDQREFFDTLITQDWQSYVDRAWDRNRAYEVSLIMRRVQSAGRVLDVGCGCGYHDVLFAREERVESVLGIDYSKNSVAVANREYPHPKVTRRVADIFEDTDSIAAAGPFDLVVSFQVIEHLEEPESFLQACAELAVSGGHVVTVTPNRDRAQNRVRTLRGLRPELVDPLHYREFTVDELEAMGRRAGLTPVSFFGRNFSFYAYRWLKAARDTPFMMRLGTFMPKVADCIGVVFRKP